MRFISESRDDFNSFSPEVREQLRNKFADMGDAGLIRRAKECHYLPGFWIRRITNSISALYILNAGEPIIVRIRDRGMLYKMITRRMRLDFFSSW